VTASGGGVDGPLLESAGDSFTAQSGELKFNAHPCEVAPVTYGSLVASHLHWAHRVLACSGAKTFNLLDLVQTGAHAPQLHEVSKSTRILTLLIGINDLGTWPFGVVGDVTTCQLVNSRRVQHATCHATQDAASLDKQLAASSRETMRALAWLHRNRPHVGVVLLSYPAVVPTVACPENSYLTRPELVTYNRIFDALNGSIATDAARAHVAYIDLYHSSLDSRGCPAWMTDVLGGAGQMANHPSLQGVESMAATIVAGLPGSMLKRMR